MSVEKPITCLEAIATNFECSCAACGVPSTAYQGSRLTRRQAFRGMMGGALGAGLLASGGAAKAQFSAENWPSRGTRPPHRDCIIEAGSALVWENDAPVIKRNVSVRVRDDRIVEISTEVMRGDARRIDARGHLLLPGFISGHTHVSVGSYTRAVIDGEGAPRPHAVVEAFDDETMDDLMAVQPA